MLRTIVNAAPLADARSLEDMFDRMFGPPHRTTAPNQGLLPVDVYEKDDALVVKAAAPGVDPEQIEITVENNVLTLKGEVKNEELGPNAKVYRREHGYGPFSRSIRLPDDLDLERVRAEFKFGFVTVTLPRLPEEKPKARRIPISTGAPTAGQ